MWGTNISGRTVDFRFLLHDNLRFILLGHVISLSLSLSKSDHEMDSKERKLNALFSLSSL